MTLKQLLTCLMRAVTNTINHDGIEHAGYLAFLALLALFPFLVFMAAVIGVIGQGETGTIYIAQGLEMLPTNIAEALRPRIVEIVSGPPQGLLTVSILGAIWTASSAVEGLRTILNRAYHVATPPAYWFRRSLSILQLLIFTFIAVIVMIVMVTVPILIQHVEQWLHLPIATPDKEFFNRVIIGGSLVALFVIVSLVYYVLPNIKQHFISVAPGAAIVVISWLGAAQLFTLYFLNFDQVNVIYGSLGGFIATLVFFYICNMIFIFGAEFNYQIVHTLGIRIEQKEEVQ